MYRKKGKRGLTFFIDGNSCGIIRNWHLCIENKLMIVYTLLVITLLIAGFSLRTAWRLGSTYSYHRLLLAVATAAFIYLFGTWVFLSVYMRYAFTVVFVGTLLFAVLWHARSPAKASPLIAAANVLCSIVLLTICVLYFTGTTKRPYHTVHLTLPFKQGTYFVFQGGKGLPTNVFHYKLRGAVYAMDLVKLNGWCNRASRIFSTRLRDYAIYNDTLYSPCNGRIAHTESANPDNIPPSRKRGPTNTNHVLIVSNSFYVFMGHLRPGCVFVQEGDSVLIGQPIGCCGNSGFSLEPHLHIQAHINTHTGLPWYKEQPLLIYFDGRTYNLFDEIYAGRQLSR